MNDSNPQENEEVYNRLVNLVTDEIISKHDIQGRMKCSLLEVNYFSVCFAVDVIGSAEPIGFYVKIPKADLVFRKTKRILPLTDADKEFGEDEYQSLIHLAKFWRSEDLGVSFVRPLGFLEDYNAIITERAYGWDFFRLFRKWDFMTRLHLSISRNPMHRFLSLIGEALSRFHKISQKDSIFKMASTLDEIKHYCSKLQSLDIGRSCLDSIESRLLVFEDLTLSTQRTNTLKGLDIRNILVDKEDRLFLLDPGKMKEDYKEADLARFLVTCRIIYWGSIAFLLRLCPDRSYEESFLQGYSNSHLINNKILTMLIIKELLKHWRMAHLALQLKAWPGAMKWVLEKVYIDRFYRKQLATEMLELERA